jgi:hypothetical protein
VRDNEYFNRNSRNEVSDCMNYYKNQFVYLSLSQFTCAFINYELFVIAEIEEKNYF